jgi:hypothetical protein
VQEKARQAAEAMAKSAKHSLKSGADEESDSAETVADAAPQKDEEKSENKGSSDADADKPPPSEHFRFVYFCFCDAEILLWFTTLCSAFDY